MLEDEPDLPLDELSRARTARGHTPPHTGLFRPGNVNLLREKQAQKRAELGHYLKP